MQASTDGVPRAAAAVSNSPLAVHEDDTYGSGLWGSPEREPQDLEP